MQNGKKTIFSLLNQHFSPAALDSLTVIKREFPARVRADLQLALERWMTTQASCLQFCGVSKQFEHFLSKFPSLVIDDPRNPHWPVPPQYEEVDIGEEKMVKCLKQGLWLLEQGKQRFAILMEEAMRNGELSGISLEIATWNEPEGTELSSRFFQQLEKSVAESTCYRGKILSLEVKDRYSGIASGIQVHKLRSVERDQVILPEKTLALLERNVIQFVAQRQRLNRLGLSTKKGILFYGPPGTGKTHTIHYLAGALPDHTTLLISAEQVGQLSEYMTLARLLQPSVVVIEDVDLIARDRAYMESVCEEVLLNKLLNEMDGLNPDADILFILTTNRPEALEAALASRPGRVDQAIEFPHPDGAGRAKLIRLYSYGAEISDEVVSLTVRKTENVSAAFIKELMRRAMQFHLERSETPRIEAADVEAAIEELVFRGGSLNRILLGVGGTQNSPDEDE